jgi:CheY-like chemotaxis protein
VLIVDDVETNRELLARLLSGVGFETRTAESGEQAVEEHDSRRPDLILMDLRMPGIGGVEAIRRLRSAGSDVPILAVSASVVGDDWRKAADAGANGFLSKPFSDAAVFARIGEVLHIDYVYGDEARRESSPPRADATELAAAVAELPGELVEELRRATIAGRIDRIGALIARVADRAPEAAERFREMADRFDYEQLLAALDTRSAS